MRTCRLFMWLVLMGLVAGMSAAAAKADGDPSGRLQGPNGGGTPGVDNEFSLPPFGPTTVVGCSYDGTNEDCTFKNQSNTNWTWASITAGAAIPCGDISFTTTLFESVTCTNDPTTHDPTVLVSGVNYSPQENYLINTTVPGQLNTCVPIGNPACTATSLQTTDLMNPNVAPNCQPSGGYFPGVLIGCDFEFILGPGPDDTGTWPLGTTFSVIAPEPSTLGMLLTGLVGLPFALRRRKSVVSA